MMEIILALASEVLLLWAMATHPIRGHCPKAWYVEGVQPAGDYACVKTPARNVCDTKAGCAGDEPRDPRLRSRIYCTGGSVPVVVDDRTVGCTRLFH